MFKHLVSQLVRGIMRGYKWSRVPKCVHWCTSSYDGSTAIAVGPCGFGDRYHFVGVNTIICAVRTHHGVLPVDAVQAAAFGDDDTYCMWL